MTTRTLDAAVEWTRVGTELVHSALAGLDEDALRAPSGLPGWTRGHVAAHLAANADALGNLVHWAATGERTPMYSSPQQRDADIEAGSTLSAAELLARFDESASRLASAMLRLAPEQWEHEVMTAQGRTVHASETPWMRAREVLVHPVDLAVGVSFADLPPDFLVALGDDVAAVRRTTDRHPALLVEPAGSGRPSWDVGGLGEPVRVVGPLPEVVAYLVGRGGAVTAEGSSAPPLPPWL